MDNRQQISRAQSHETVAQHTDVTWFTSRGEAMSMGTVFVLYLERVNIVPLQPIVQLEIFWETPCTHPGALLS